MLPFGTPPEITLPADPLLAGALVHIVARAMLDIVLENRNSLAVETQPKTTVLAFGNDVGSYDTEPYRVEIGIALVSGLSAMEMLRFHVKTSFFAEKSGEPAYLKWSVTPMDPVQIS